MRDNIFLRSVLRQPGKVAILLGIMALTTIAFVSQASEYLLIRQETERLGNFYKSVGTLHHTREDKWTNTSEAVAYLESNPYVEVVNVVNRTSAIMEEKFCNADTGTDGPGKESCYMAFYGTLLSWDYSHFRFTVDTVLAGYPEYITTDTSIVMFLNGNSILKDIDTAHSRLEKGARYLVTGYYMPSAFPGCKVETGLDGNRTTYILLNPISEDHFFYPVPDNGDADWSSTELYQWRERISQYYEGQRVLDIIALNDMEAFPLTQNRTSGIYLTKGRWIGREDDTLNRKVCVINAAFATMRELSVGDTITLKLRDIPSYLGGYNLDAFSIVSRTKIDEYEIVGIYDYISAYKTTLIRNITYIPSSAVPEYFLGTTSKNTDTGMYEHIYNTYLGARSCIPYPGEVSFLLTNQENEPQFIMESRENLARLGFEPVMIENNWSNFQTAALPIKHSSLLNAIFFSVLLLVTICLLAVIYYRMCRKDIAIARALGITTSRCARDVSIPLIIIGSAGMGIGGWLGWRYTLNDASDTLLSLSGFGDGTAATLSTFWLILLLAVASVLLLVVTLFGALFLADRPVLLLIQNGVPVARKEKDKRQKQKETTEVINLATPLVPPILVAVPAHQMKHIAPPKNSMPNHVLRFIWCHITRAKLKSILSIFLAAGFTLGLAAIQLSIVGSQERVDWLYENTVVEAELLLADTTQDTHVAGFLRQTTIDTLLDSGYVTGAYLEGSTKGAVVHYMPGMEDSQGLHVTQENTIKKTVRAFADESVFLSPAGSGGAVTITYLDGWDGSLFAGDWAADQLFPVVLPRDVYTQFDDKIGLSCKGFRVCEVAGYYEGEVAVHTGESDPVLIPLSAYQDMGTTYSIPYCKAHVTLPASLNRNLEKFNKVISDIANSQYSSMFPLRAVIWDEELRLAVAPLENSIELMRVLYPVTLMLSMMVAAGIALLYVMTSAKEAAIMRVLGTTKRRSAAMLALQNVLTSLAGLLLGLLGILAYTGRMQPELLASFARTSVVCALLYLLATVIGAGVSSMVVTSRNPLELLQVKE